MHKPGVCESWQFLQIASIVAFCVLPLSWRTPLNCRHQACIRLLLVDNFGQNDCNNSAISFTRRNMQSIIASIKHLDPFVNVD